jgi:ABC-2 type transport system permease protein
MKKYLYILKSEFKSNITYTLDILLGFIGYIIIIFIFLNLWNYIYSDPNELINGFTMNETIWYVIITEILWTSMAARKLSKKICNDVKEGNITYNLNKPYNYIEFIIFNHLGDFLFRYILITIIGITMGIISLGGLPNYSIIGFIGVIITSLFSGLINTIIVTFIGLLSFYIEDAHPIYWMYSKFILILGTVFPPSFFPGIISTFIKYSPIYASTSAPAMLFVKPSLNLFIKTIGLQIFYIVILLLLLHLFYKKGVKRLNVNGG